MKTLVINLFAGPGTGKSTSCAQIFSELKWMGIDCEMAMEFAKDLVWEESIKVLKNQIYVFANQYHRLKRLEGKVNIIITDSPLLLSILYDTSNNEVLNDLTINSHNKFNNYNVFLKREKVYRKKGRLQDIEDAKLLDRRILKLLKDNQISFTEIPGNKHEITKLSSTIAHYYNDFKEGVM